MQGQVINDQNKLGLLNAMAQGGSAAAAAYNSAQAATQDYKAQAIDKAIGASTAPYAMPGGAGGELASLVGKYTAGAEENTGIAARNAGGIGSGYESAVKSYLDKQRSQLDSDLAYQSAMLNEQRIRSDAQARAAKMNSAETQAAIAGDAEAMQQQVVADAEKAKQDKWETFKDWANQTISEAPKTRENPNPATPGDDSRLGESRAADDKRTGYALGGAVAQMPSDATQQKAESFKQQSQALPEKQAQAEQAIKDFAAFQRFVAVSKYGMNPSVAAGMYSSNPLYNREQAARLEAMAPPDPIEQAKRQKEAYGVAEWQDAMQYADNLGMDPDTFLTLKKSAQASSKSVADALASPEWSQITTGATTAADNGASLDEFMASVAADEGFRKLDKDQQRLLYRLASTYLKPSFEMNTGAG